jgi:hypothetical protein
VTSAPIFPSPSRFLAPLAARIRRFPGLTRFFLRLIPDWRWTLRIPKIGPLRIRLRRHRYLWLQDRLTTENFPFAALERITAPGSVVFDIGANIGPYTRFLHSLGSPARVVSFEPWLENVEILHENLQLGGIASPRSSCPRRSDRDGTVAFQVDDIE